MDYPLYVNDKRQGILRVTAEGQDTCFEVRCPPMPGLYRAYVQGERGRLLLGVMEGEGLRRRFSPTLTSPIGRILSGRMEESVLCQADDWTSAPEDWLAQYPPFPPETLFCRRGRRYYLAIPYAEEKPFPLEKYFCFARVRTMDGRLRAVFIFDRDGNPLI